MKRLKRIIPVLLLVILGYCLPVSAEDAENDALIQWKTDEKQENAALTLVPDQELRDNAVTAMQITMLVTDISGQNAGISVAFDEGAAGAYRIADYTYSQEKKELNIFLSDTKLLFDKDTKSCSIGTVSFSTADPECEVNLQPVSVKTVNQSHVLEEIQSQDLAGMTVNLKKSAGAGNPEEPDDPNKPGNPDDPNKPENPDDPNKPGNPDNPGNPDQPDSNPAYDSVQDVVKELTEGQSAEITLKLGKDAVLSEEDQKTVFQALKGSDKSLTFSVEDEGVVLYSFTFRGDQITNENVVMDFRLTSLISSPEIEKLLQKGAQNLFLEFSHSGSLPGPVQVKVYAGSVFADGQKLYLYYYNPDKKALEPVQKELVVAEGYVTFELTHCSAYVLTTMEVKEAGKFPVPGSQTQAGSTDGKKETQRNGVVTGDNSPVAVYVILIIAALAAMIAVVWKRLKK